VHCKIPSMMRHKGGWETLVYLDENLPGGGGGPICLSCRRLIERGQRARIEFNTDPNGDDGLTGDYHIACSKPFAALARVINMNLWR